MQKNASVLVLGIESSCDETAIALVKDNFEVITSLVVSQIKLHQPFGGVVPEIAARSHLMALPPLFDQIKALPNFDLKKIDAIAVTQGPGLIGALLVGVSFAKGLALATGKPLVPVNHVHAHVAGALLGLDSKQLQTAFPALALVVTGGHTHLYYMKNATTFYLIGFGIDDACGESFDKVAKQLGYEYPGGPVIEKLAKNGDPKKFAMPHMVPGSSNMNFSYSGLKTAVSVIIRQQKPPYSDQFKHDICASFQDEALNQLIRKLKNGLTKHPEVKSIIIAGGVAANEVFRNKLRDSCKLNLILPELKYCSDNAAMIASLGSLQLQHSKQPATWDAFSNYPYV